VPPARAGVAAFQQLLGRPTVEARLRNHEELTPAIWGKDQLSEVDDLGQLGETFGDDGPSRSLARPLHAFDGATTHAEQPAHAFV
jgi:hypothetical protein